MEVVGRPGVMLFWRSERTTTPGLPGTSRQTAALMKQRLSILQSKFWQPECAQTLHRGRLVERLGEISRKRLALVVAGAGCGKTTLVAQAVEALRIPVVWYSLDPMDRDFGIFLAYLTAGIQKHRPDFGQDLGRRVTAVPPDQRLQRTFLLEFLEACESRASDDLVIVLDDFHAVQQCQEVAETVQFLLARCPRSMHWIVVSRTDPPLKVSRYRTMADVIDIAEADLSFRRDEIERLYRDLLKVDIDAADVRRLYEKTGGWAVGLVLFFNALKTSAARQPMSALFEIGHTRRLVFQYLEENIFDGQPQATRQFMMHSSLLSRLDPDICDTAFHTTASRQILATLSAHHLLTFPDGDAGHTFRYHHLLQEFLQDKLTRTYGKSEVARLHRAIGNAMNMEGNVHGALQHYRMGRHYEEICRIFEKMVFSDFMECPFHFIIDTFEQIPSPILNQNPRMLYMAAKLSSLGGEIQQSLDGFRCALSQFEALGDAAGILTCQKEVAFYCYLTGDLPQAKRQMLRLWGRRHDDAFFPAEIAGYLILFCALLGQLEEADAYYRRAGRISGLSQIERQLVRSYLDFCYAYRWHNSGSFEKADALNRQSMETFARLGMEPMLPLAHFQTALTLFFLRRPEEGGRHAQKGLALARQLGIFDAQYAWLIYADGLNRLGCGEFERAREAAEESLDIFDRQQHPWGQAAACELRGMIERGRNDRQAALRFFRKALKGLEGRDFPVAVGSIVLGLAETLIDENQGTPADALLERHAKEIGVSAFYRFRRHLLRARRLARLPDTTQAVAELRTALGLARQYRYDRWLLEDLPRIAPLLVACHAAGVMEAYVQKLLHQGGRTTREALWALKTGKGQKAGGPATRLLAAFAFTSGQTAPLDIRGLGAFTVAVGNIAIRDEQWKNVKARKIFQYLALKHNQGFVPKDVLLELIWPEEDATLTRKRFHVAMTFLRKLMEPRLKRGFPSAYILRRNDAYRLEIGNGGRIDFVDFKRSIETAQRLEKKDEDGALGQYLKAAELYRGPLFEETPYEEGFAEDREALQARYLHALEKILRGFEKQAAWDRCIEVAERYLAVDRYAERLYCDLMRYHFCRSEPARIAQVFERCKSRINDDLGFALKQSTVSLYRELQPKHPVSEYREENTE